MIPSAQQLSFRSPRRGIRRSTSALDSSAGVRTLGLAIAPALVWVQSHPAAAQRTSENAVTQSSDGFGQQVGGERTGLYGPDDVRGFDPVDAGNVRIQSLYFDQVDRPSARILDGTRIRVGLSALGFAFPAPTGLVDYALREPGPEPYASLEIGSEPYFGRGMTLEGAFPIGDAVGLSAGIAGRDHHRPEGGTHRLVNFGSTLAISPYANAKILVFGGAVITRGEEARPTLFPAGEYLPPRMERRQFIGQPWADRSTNSKTFGVTALFPISGFKVEAGLFKTRRDSVSNFADIMSGVRPDGFVEQRTIVADAGSFDQSVSGELRVAYEASHGAVMHRITGSIRGRERTRAFGGSQRIQLGASTALAPDPRQSPGISGAAKNRDDVNQLTYGLGYNLNWKDLLTFDAGVSKTDYNKHVHFADPAAPDVVAHDSPLIWNASGSVTLTRDLLFDAGITRGQEEAMIAPDVAINRSESPPAILTQQIEGGLQWRITSGLSLLAGIFSIAKPYYNLDAGLRYLQLGEIRNSGVEVSLAGRLAPGLTFVGGTVFLDPQISGELVQSGEIGARPVGQSRRRSAVNLDWRTNAGRGALSLDLAVESHSSRYANAQNTFRAPGFSTFDLGARYRLVQWNTPIVIRAQLLNAFDTYGWRVSQSGGFSYSNGRTATVQLIADF